MTISASLARRLLIRSRRLLMGPLAGMARTPQRARGRAFEGVRAYVPGDDVRDIDWKVSARMRRPFIKSFADERERRLWLVVDTSPSMAFASGATSKQMRAVELAALLCVAATFRGDRIGLATFGGDSEVMPPSRSTHQAERIVHRLLNLASGERAIRGEPAISSLFEKRRIERGRRSLFLVLSDFLFSDAEVPMNRLAARHDVVAVGIVDPWERSIGNVGVSRWRDLETGDTLVIDAGHAPLRRQFQLRRETWEREFAGRLATSAIPLLMSSTDEPEWICLARYLRR